MVQALKQLGPGVLLYKVNISRALLRIDPGDTGISGIKPKHLLLDRSLPLGERHRSIIRSLDAITCMMSQKGHNDLMNYIHVLPTQYMLSGNLILAYRAFRPQGAQENETQGWVLKFYFLNIMILFLLYNSARNFTSDHNCISGLAPSRCSQRPGQDVQPKVKQFAMTLETRKGILKTKGTALNLGQSRVK